MLELGLLTWINGRGLGGGIRFAAMNARLFLVGMALTFGSWEAGLAAADKATHSFGNTLGIEMVQQQSVWKVYWNEQLMLLYTFAEGQFKPYVKELRALTGENVLRDAPADHLHHHGLMYAIRVNGINFWEETPQSGYQKPVGSPRSTVTSRSDQQVRVTTVGGGTKTVTRSLSRATFSHRIHWVSAENKSKDDPGVALLVEDRTLVLSIDEPAGEVALEWQAEFTAGPAAAEVELSGADYHGLGLRLPAVFDRVARRQSSAGTPFSEEATRDVQVAEWNSQSARMNGRDLTVALLGQPEGMGGPQRFFSMLNPFAYISVTQALDQQPVKRAAGATFSLRYLLLIYGVDKSRTALSDRFDTWRLTFPDPAP